MKPNTLIAEFMGGIPSSVPNLINLPQTIGESRILCVKGSEGLPSGTYAIKRINDLKYHSSWDWLMPVVAKCTELNNDEFDNQSIAWALLSNSIIDVYDQVVEFIKDYNDGKKQ